MSTTIVRAKAVMNGTELSSSVLFDPAFRVLTGALDLDVSDMADPNFSVVLQIHIQLRPGHWEPTDAVKEWFGGLTGEPPPTVVWQGYARRARLSIDANRPASIGASITSQ